ncbi:hypothetical protein CSA80_02565 [Candidatus Saccharibacteria bacterium]|nr:MAG: hypothetical protein CSA80_02565 [Candidatus Saccharibacteria bacterium]
MFAAAFDQNQTHARSERRQKSEYNPSRHVFILPECGVSLVIADERLERLFEASAGGSVGLKIGVNSDLNPI